MGFINKLFGNTKTENNTTEDLNYINSILEFSKDAPLGTSKQNLIYVGYSELGGYYYVQTYIIGKLKVKAKTGATLKIVGDNYTLNLKSDMDEFESEPADRFKGHVTNVDFEIEKDALEKISRSTIKELVFTTKKENIVFSKFEANTNKS